MRIKECEPDTKRTTGSCDINQAIQNNGTAMKNRPTCKVALSNTLHRFYSQLLKNSNELSYKFLYKTCGEQTVWRVVRWIPYKKQVGVYSNIFEAFELNSERQRPTLLSIHVNNIAKYKPPFKNFPPSEPKQLFFAIFSDLHNYATNYTHHIHLIIVSKPQSYQDYVNHTGICSYEVYRWSAGLVGGVCGMRIKRVDHKGIFAAARFNKQRLDDNRGRLRLLDRVILNNIWEHIHDANPVKAPKSRRFKDKQRLLPKILDLGFCDCFPKCNCYNTGLCNCSNEDTCSCSLTLGSIRTKDKEQLDYKLLAGSLRSIVLSTQKTIATC